jgi:PleD family two-component response regulator
MSEEVLAHARKGTGIGLSMVQEMAAQLGGVVTINSRAGHGTSVSVFFPRASGVAVKGPIAESSPVMTGNGRILVVEDDAGVLSFLSETLAELGYEALAVADTESALSIVEQGEQFDVVLSDF